MTLLTAHKILISSAVALFVLLAVRGFLDYANGDPRGLLFGVVSAVIAVGLLLYLRWVWIRRPGDDVPRPLSR